MPEKDHAQATDDTFSCDGSTGKVLHLKLTYRQFLDLTGQEKAPQITQTKMESRNIA